MRMSEADKRKLESEQRAIIRTTNNDLQRLSIAYG